MKRGPFSRQGGHEDAEEGSQRGTDSLGATTGRRRGNVGGGLSPAGDQRPDVLHEVPELRQSKEENTKLKRPVADLPVVYGRRAHRPHETAQEGGEPAARAVGHSEPSQRWSMDFVSDRLVDGRWFRVLTVVDQLTRECVGLEAD